MRCRRLARPACTLALLVTAATCAPRRALPPGERVLGSDPLADFRLTGGEMADAEMETVSVEGRPFARALRVQTKRKPARTYDIQLRATTTVPVKKGDVCLATFHARCVEPDAAATEFVFETARKPWSKSATKRVALAKQWKRFDVPFEPATGRRRSRSEE